MSKIKIGDNVIIKDKSIQKNNLLEEQSYIVVRVTGDEVFIKVNESTLVGVNMGLVKKVNPDYLKSNRYLLSLAVKGSGFSAKALSRALVGNESYFYNKTGEARFIKNGDVSDEYYSQLLIDVSTAVDILEGTKKQVDSELDFDLSLIKSESKEFEFQPTGYETPEDFNQDLKVTPEEVQEVKKSIEQNVSKETDAEIEEKTERKGAFILMSVIIILILIFTYLAFK